MIRLRLSLLCLLALAAPAVAQQSPPPGVLRLPPKNAPAPAPDPVVTAQPAPLTPVQQVAPFDTPQVRPPLQAPPPDASPPPKPVKAAKPKPKPKPAPVIQAQPNVHAQRPPGGGVAAPPAKPPPEPPPTEAPAVAPPDNSDTMTGHPGPAVGSVTKLPLPRWASLRSDEVNLRVGAGTRFPIDWQYHRRDLPVQIVDERDAWRRIRDQDGVVGWVHRAALAGHRGFVVKGALATMRGTPADTGDPVAYLKPGVVGRLRSCEAGSAWCEVQVGDHRGYLKREQFYGSSAGEALPN